jgi:hypothetical protein
VVVVLSLEKNKVLFILFLPFFAGLILMVYAWWSSYPLSMDSIFDVIFNHVSLLYWVSVPLLLGSMCMISISFKNQYVKWIAAIGIVLTIYSLSYFYYMMPGSDSQAFRGMTEYFIKTKDLDASKLGHSYFQWPSFFLLSDMATSVSGLGLANFEFLLYTIIGFLLATGMYAYASRAYKHEGFLAVVTFFAAMFYFLNYQDVPFSLAFGLLFLLFMLETRQKNLNVILTELVLFTCITFTHAFVPLFFILYLLIRFMLHRSSQHGRLALMTLIIYLLVQLSQASSSFFNNIIVAFTNPSEYSSITKAILAPVSVPFDEIAQMFSRYVTIATIMICFAGFTILLIKRKMRDLDIAIFLTGVVYSTVGIGLSALGSRAIPLIFMPISLGAAYFLKTRFRPYVIALFLVLIILFVFIPIHGTFGSSQIFFQTRVDYQTENFLIDHYNWTNPSLMLAHYRVITYLEAKQPSPVRFEDDVYSPLFPRIEEYDCIVYTVGLGINLLRYNYTTDSILHENILNVIYDAGSSYIALKSSNFTYAPTG